MENMKSVATTALQTQLATNDQQTSVEVTGKTGRMTLTKGDVKTLISAGVIPQDTPEGMIRLYARYCADTGLSPFKRQVHLVKRGAQFMIQTGIDGYRSNAEKTGRYMPGPEPTFHYDKEGELVSATAFVRRWDPKTNAWMEIAATAYHDEYVQYKSDGAVNSMWMKMPHGQLAKCAEALALRKAFPDEMGEARTDEEMAQADNPPEIVEQRRVEVHQPEAQGEVDNSEARAIFTNEGDAAEPSVDSISKKHVAEIMPVITGAKAQGHILLAKKKIQLAFDAGELTEADKLGLEVMVEEANEKLVKAKK